MAWLAKNNKVTSRKDNDIGRKTACLKTKILIPEQLNWESWALHEVLIVTDWAETVSTWGQLKWRSYVAFSCKLNFWSSFYSIYIVWKLINMPLRFQSFISAMIIMINATLLSRALPPHLQCWTSNYLFLPYSCNESATIKPQVELKLKFPL